MKNQILILVSFLFLLLSGCGIGGELDIADTQPAIKISAENLLIELREDQNFQNDQFIAVTGRIYEMNTKNGSPTILISGNKDGSQYIICEMDKAYTATLRQLEIGDAVVLKGLLRGYLNDAILQNCILEKKLIHD